MRFDVVFSNDEGTTVRMQTGRSTLWRAQDYVMDYPDNPARGGRLTFAWGYYAAKSAGKLEELGIDESASVDDAINTLADWWELDIDEVKASDPLAPGQGTSQQ